MLNQYPPVITRSKSVATQATPQIPNEEAMDRCDTAMEFMQRWNPSGPWVLRRPGKSKKFHACDGDNIKSFILGCTKNAQPMEMFLPSVDAFREGDVIHMSEAGRCDTICLRVNGTPDEIRCKSEELGWPPSSANLLIPQGMFMLWRIGHVTDWMTVMEVAKIMASRIPRSEARLFCPLPGAYKGVVFLDAHPDDRYNLKDFMPPPVQESKDDRPEAVFRQYTPHEEPRGPRSSGSDAEVRFPNEVIMSETQQ
jgi:hypothetical protein